MVCVLQPHLSTFSEWLKGDKAIPISTIISEEYETYDFRKAMSVFNANVK